MIGKTTNENQNGRIYCSKKLNKKNEKNNICDIHIDINFGNWTNSR